MLLNIVQRAGDKGVVSIAVPTLFIPNSRALNRLFCPETVLNHRCRNLPLLGYLVSNAASGFTGVIAQPLSLQEEEAGVS